MFWLIPIALGAAALIAASSSDDSSSSSTYDDSNERAEAAAQRAKEAKNYNYALKSRISIMQS